MPRLGSVMNTSLDAIDAYLSGSARSRRGCISGIGWRVPSETARPVV